MRVIDLTQYEAGPSATQILAWLGADVIKVEPPSGEPGRYLMTGSATRDSIIFVLFNQNKRSVTLDLATDADRQHLRDLLRGADVLAENFAPGTLARLGFPIDDLMRQQPELIVASVRGFAAGGPWSDFKSLDFVGQAVGGAMSVTGAPTARRYGSASPSPTAAAACTSPSAFSPRSFAAPGPGAAAVSRWRCRTRS